MTRRFRVLRVLLSAVLIAAVAVGLGTVLPRPLLPPGPSAQADEPSLPATRTVFVLSSAIHTDLALPASPDIVERFGFMAADGLDPGQPGVAYVLAGWGSRAFYIETPTWSELKPGPLVKALTLDRSVMHIGLGGDIDPDHPSVTAIDLDEASFEALVRAVLGSFTLDGGGRRMVVPDASYGEYDLFYEAEGSFNALAGCNVWTAAVLRQAGLTTGWWTPLPGLLTASLHLHNDDGVRD